MPDFPSRADSHILEKRSERFFKNHLPIEWIINKPEDYGLDYYIEIAQGQNITGLNFGVQLKAHERLSDKGEALVTLKRSTVNMYLTRLAPILLICYVADENEAYFDWFRENSIDLTKDHASNTIKINKANKLSKLDWAEVTGYVGQIFSRKFLLHVHPEVDFSDLKHVDERKAFGFYIEGHYDRAEQIFKTLLNSGSNVVWFNGLAMCQYALYRYREALATVNKALENYDHPNLWINKACILAEDGIRSRDKAKLLEAKAIFSKATGLHNEAHTYYNFANTLTELGELDEAMKNFKKALKINPNYAQAWKNLGEVYFRLHQHKKEQEAYVNALKIDPELPEALASLGIYNVRNNLFQQGIELIEKAARISPVMFENFLMAYFWLAKGKIGLGKWDDAYRYIQKGLSTSPGDTALLDLKRDYLYRGWNEQQSNSQPLLDFLRYRVELDGRDLKSFSMLVHVLVKTKQIGKALDLIRINTSILKDVDEQTLVSSGLPLETFLKGLESYPQFHVFREFMRSRMLDVYDEGESGKWTVDLIMLGAHHEALEVCRNKSMKNLELHLIKAVTSYLAEYFPLMASIIYQGGKNEEKHLPKEIARVMAHIVMLITLYQGVLIGYMGGFYKLNQGKLDKAMKNRNFLDNVSENILINLQQNFKLFEGD